MATSGDNGLLAVSREINDSSSEYSVQEPPVDVFEDSDAEADGDRPELQTEGHGGADDYVPYTKADIMKWSPAEVSQYLQSRQIPPATCIKFEEQEVTGAILLQLEMSHMKELEIGSFGKRFEVWKEIERLVKNLKPPTAKPRSGSDAAQMSTVGFVSEADNGRQRRSTVGSIVLPRIRSEHDRPPSRHHRINIQQANSYQSGFLPLKTPMTSTTISSEVASPRSPMFGLWEHPRSPPLSPVLVARRHSVFDHPLNAATSIGAAVLAVGGGEIQYQHESPFDKNWTSGFPGASARPATATGLRENKGKHKQSASTGTADIATMGDSGFFAYPYASLAVATERSYFSSGETVPRERKVLQKKNGSIRPRHSWEYRLTSIAAPGRHTRIASAGAEAMRRTSTSTLSAAMAYHKGGKDKHKRQSASFSGDIGLSDYELPSMDDGRSASPAPHAPTRSISGTLKSSIEDKSTPVSPRSSTSASTPSVTITTPSSPPSKVERKQSTRKKSTSGLRQKSKRKTSAWENGLLPISPSEAAEKADFSGWMKKRGSSGVGAWKSRFFVLNGRRLSYFYSMKDVKERGLIDITSHKVLPATDDRLVGIHAALAAATSPTGSPRPATFPHSQPEPSTPKEEVPKTPKKEKEKDKKEKDKKEKDKDKKEKDKEKKPKDEGWFTFKLVPPAPGAAKGMTFTPPRLHYFATDTREDGKKWMAAMMKATIDRDETKPVVTSYNAKTISLTKARELRARPSDLPIDKGGLGIELGSEADVEDSAEGKDSGYGFKFGVSAFDGDSHTTIDEEDMGEDEEGPPEIGRGRSPIDHSMFEQPRTEEKCERDGLMSVVHSIGILG